MTTQERRALLRRYRAVADRALDFEHYSTTREAREAEKELLHAVRMYRSYRSKLAVKYGWHELTDFENWMRDPLTYSI